jgi:hypothetical protein
MTDPHTSENSTIGGRHQVPNVEGEGSKPLATAVLAMRSMFHRGLGQPHLFGRDQ